MEPQDKIILYGYWRSSATWRTRLALNLKGINYETVPVNLLKGDQLSDDHKTKNPNATIPVLSYNGNNLIQSIAILEFLEEVSPNRPLLPKDPVSRATVRAIVDLICCDIHPIQNLRVLKRVGDADSKAWANHWITRGFDALEKILEKTAGKCCFGDEVTLADCALIPQQYNAVRFEVDMAKYPIISRIVAELSELEAFKKSHPSAQIDAVI